MDQCVIAAEAIAGHAGIGLRAVAQIDIDACRAAIQGAECIRDRLAVGEVGFTPDVVVAAEAIKKRLIEDVPEKTIAEIAARRLGLVRAEDRLDGKERIGIAKTVHRIPVIQKDKDPAGAASARIRRIGHNIF